MELEKACEHVFQVVEKFVMQTFLPYPDFAQSLRVLDSRRLGKQRLEAMQLLRAISADGSGWSRHPAAAMWRGYTNALKQYHNLAMDAGLSQPNAETGHPRENHVSSLAGRRIFSCFAPIQSASEGQGILWRVRMARTGRSALCLAR